MDFPEKQTRQNLFAYLDKIVQGTGGRLYPAKDAHMLGCDFREAYPNWQLLEKLRDPTIQSHFWKRVIQ